MSEARTCGECTVCCTVLAIETAEFRKVPGRACGHCTAQGCGIYETRYPICRSYFCGWFGLAELDDGWRPDRSGILISPCDAAIPASYEARDGIEFLVLGGETAVRRPAFAALVARLLRNRTPAFLAVPGPAGHYPARVFLNDALARTPVAALGDAFASILNAAKGHRFEPVPP